MAALPYMLELPLPPSVNFIWDERMVLTKEAHDYKTLVAQRATSKSMQPLIGTVSLTVWVYFRRRHRDGNDVSNRLKLLEDSLCGHAYLDDSQVDEIHLYRRYDKHHPRVVVRVQSK